MLKKILSLLLVLALAAGLNTAVFAANSDKITRVIKPIDTNDDKFLNEEVISAGTVARFPLSADMFRWSNGDEKGVVGITSAQAKDLSVDTRDLDSSIVKKVSLIHNENVSGIGKTSVVEVEFVEEWEKIDTEEFDFMIFLKIDKARQPDSELEWEGEFGNEVEEIDADEDYISLRKGTAIEPNDYIREIELGLGDGLSMFTRLFSGTKYYGYAESKVTQDDSDILDKYPEIITIYNVTTVNLRANDKCVLIADYPDCYVYDDSFKYLGKTEDRVVFSKRYYITDERIDTDGGSSDEEDDEEEEEEEDDPSSSQSSGSNSTSSSGSKPNSTKSITVEDATELAEDAADSAKSSGAGTASVRIKDVSSISLDAIKSISQTATDSGLYSQLNADTMSGSSVVGRVTFNPANATTGVNLGVYVDQSSVRDVQEKFENWYTNDLEVIALSQKGSYGMTVTISAKIDTSDIGGSNLYFYSYDRSTNKYRQLTGTGAKIDKSGYLQFKTSYGGDIIVSKGALVVG